jgi:hypothetical protein
LEVIEMVLKIKTKKLTTFLNKIRLSGKQMLEDCVLNFEEAGLKVARNNLVQTARVMGVLKTVSFIQYEAIGKVALNDMRNIVEVFERFGDEITLKKEGNLLTINSEKKSVDIELVDENFLSTDSVEPTLTFDDTFSVQSNTIKDIFKDVRMNKDSTIKIITTDKKVNIKNTGKYKFNSIIDCNTVKGGVEVGFGEPFMDVITNLDGNLEISVKSDYPAKIIEKTEDSIISIIVAPRVEDG